MDFLAIVAIIAIMGAVVYKRHIFDRQTASRGALDAAAVQLRNSIELTAELMIERMQEQAEQLTFIINESDSRIAALDERIKRLELLIKQAEAAKLDVQREASELKAAAKHQQELTEKQSAGRRTIEKRETELNKRIFSLLDKGEKIEQISRLTGVGKGAVALIEQMYKNERA